MSTPNQLIPRVVPGTLKCDNKECDYTEHTSMSEEMAETAEARPSFSCLICPKCQQGHLRFEPSVTVRRGPGRGPEKKY